MTDAIEQTKRTTRGPRKKGSDAINHPVHTPRREISTEDHPIGQLPPIILPEHGPVVREAEEIVLPEALEAGGAEKYNAELAFMEEPVEIHVNPGSEKFAPKVIDVYVNGRPEWIPVGQNWIVPRKYVEVLARTKPVDVQTESGSIGDERPENKIVRFTRVKHPFQIVRDDNPRGMAWFARILAEN